MTRHISSLLAAVLLLLASACSSGPDMLKFVSSSDALVITGSATDVLENAGAKVSGDVISLTPELQRYFDTDRDRVSLGIDPDHFLVTVNYDAGCMLMAAPLTSKATFEKAIATLPEVMRTRTERSGMDIYTIRHNQHAVITNDMLFIVSPIGYRPLDPEKAVNQAIERASSSPLTSWQRSALEADNTLNVLLNIGAFSSLIPGNVPSYGYDPEEVAKGFLRISGKLKGQEVKFAGQLLSDAGKVLTNNLLTEKVDKSMLKFLSDGSVAAMAMAFSPEMDWHQMLSTALALPLAAFVAPNDYNAQGLVDPVADILEKIDGTVLIGLEPGSLMTLNTPEGWGLTLAAQLREGTSAEFVQNLQELCRNESIPNTAVEGGFEAVLPQIGTVRVLNEKGVFFITNLPASAPRGDCKNISSSDFSDAAGALVIRLPKDHPLLSAIGFKAGVEIVYKATPEQVDLNFRLTDTSLPLIQALIQNL